MSDFIPAADVLNVDALYLGSVIDSMTTLSMHLHMICAGIQHGALVPAEFPRIVRAHLSDLAEQFEILANLYPDLSGMEPDRSIFAVAAAAPASFP